MRATIKTRSSTKAERIFAETLKRNHIAYKHRVRVGTFEVDFIIGKYAIEIDGHEQNAYRNHELIQLGYIPIHYQNSAIRTNLSAIEDDIKLKYGKLYTKSTSSGGSR